MTARRATPASDRRPCGGSLLRSWLLVLLVAFDLVSSPFHGHPHDVGAGGNALATYAAAEHAAASALAHAHPDAGPGAGHSLMALLPAELPRVPVHGVTAAPALAPPQARPPAPTAALQWRFATAQPLRLADDRHWRPSGRAPPPRHG